MKIFGFRSDPTTPRYAVVDGSTAPLMLINADTESRLRFPAECSTEAAQVTWLYREFERIFHTHPDITRVVIKKASSRKATITPSALRPIRKRHCSCIAAFTTSRWSRRFMRRWPHGAPKSKTTP